MKIYFCCSIRGGRDDVKFYGAIVQWIKGIGTVLTEHVSRPELTEKGEDVSAVGDKHIHDRDIEWLQEADVVIAEVTQPSLGVGYEIGRAVAMNKKVLCLFRPSSGRVLSAMIRGANDGCRFLVRDYTEDTMQEVLQEYFEKIFPAIK
ncbi:2'-deoxynucleoside 5'-phosphate N-hydrolase 1 [Protopterus annectens]|uniref:2'-deoxynucleoside 5'-phosphate N-hydrolase 1 n=1 Tax=Protopterus annectens TaxID=7888 RepID=UPI001CFAFE9A|nr:2'-deoxynucleoside 5'-phosphate N-hydrolase 1 [Protopterus annectens]